MSGLVKYIRTLGFKSTRKSSKDDLILDVLSSRCDDWSDKQIVEWRTDGFSRKKKSPVGPTGDPKWKNQNAKSKPSDMDWKMESKDR